MFKIALILFSIFFVGCSEKKLLLETYTSPAKPKVVKNILSANSISSGFLEVEIFKDLNYITDKKSDTSHKQLAKNLISDMEQLITQTNFIALSKIGNVSPVVIDMKIVQLNLEYISNKLNGLIKVQFNIRKNGSLIYSKTYQTKINRQGDVLPHRNEILSEASTKLAKKFIKDISPLKTKKLVTIKDLSDKLNPAIVFAEKGDFKNAITIMLKFKDDKDENYYYDLAVFYEALAAKNEDLGLLEKANQNYSKAMELSKGKDKIILDGVTKFNKYYEIVKNISEQKLKNKLQEEAYDEFEILE